MSTRAERELGYQAVWRLLEGTEHSAEVCALVWRAVYAYGNAIEPPAPPARPTNPASPASSSEADR